jgi:undecaprenyl diphosphate synthase
MTTMTRRKRRRNDRFLHQAMAFSTLATTTVTFSVLHQRVIQRPRQEGQQQFGFEATRQTYWYYKRIPFVRHSRSRLNCSSSSDQDVSDNFRDDHTVNALPQEKTNKVLLQSSSSLSTVKTNKSTNHTIPLRHVALICDGNSRWAKAHHLPTYVGYKQGADRLVQLLEHLTTTTTTTTTTNTMTLGIDYVTVYAFSTENWQRTIPEIQEIFAVIEFTAQSLLQLLLLQRKKQQQHQQHQNHPWWSSLSNNSNSSTQQGQRQERPIQVRILGDLDDPRMPNTTRNVLRKLEQVTTTTTTTINNKIHTNKNNDNYHHNDNTLIVCLAINYGGRQDIVTACQALAQQVADGTLLPNQITQQHVQQHLSYTATIPDPDIVIRTSGECRLSNFLLWNIAYTELYFIDTFWPDFDLSQWQKALQWYLQRHRRFGISSNGDHTSSIAQPATMTADYDYYNNDDEDNSVWTISSNISQHVQQE